MYKILLEILGKNKAKCSKVHVRWLKMIKHNNTQKRNVRVILNYVKHILLKFYLNIYKRIPKIIDKESKIVS